MKYLVAGLVLLTISLSALVWQRRLESAAPRGGRPQTEIPRGPERQTRCMVWKAQRGAAVVWLCGSIHTLRAEDYPLPGPYLRAFEESKRIVMELPPDYVPGAAMRAMGLLKDGETLRSMIAPATWQALTEWSARRGALLSSVETLKPWSAALTVSLYGQKARGFRSEDGMETWFRARLGTRSAEGLETAEAQLGIFDSLTPEDQERMLGIALREDAAGVSRIDRMIAAWHEGRADELGRVMAEGFAEMPALRRQLQEERHAAWLPRIEALLSGTETSMVLVGSGHLAGEGSLVELLTRKGAVLEQQSFTTTRPAPESP